MCVSVCEGQIPHSQIPTSILCPVYVLLTNSAFCPCAFSSSSFIPPSQDPAGIFELVELVGNGTYGQVYKVRLNNLPLTCWCVKLPPINSAQATFTLYTVLYCIIKNLRMQKHQNLFNVRTIRWFLCVKLEVDGGKQFLRTLIVMLSTFAGNEVWCFNDLWWVFSQ